MSSLPGVQIVHGQLLDISGRPITFGNVMFLPAVVQLNGSDWTGEFPFDQWSQSSARKLPRIVRADQSAAWVLGRLMYLFDTPNSSSDQRIEKSCFCASFIAFFPELDNKAIPFCISDLYGSTYFYFSSDDAPPLELRRSVADQFYALLLDDPTSVLDYKNKVYHSGLGSWIDFGVSCGEPYMDLRNPQAAKHLADILRRMYEPASINDVTELTILDTVGVSFWYKPLEDPICWGGSITEDIPPGEYLLLLEKDGTKCKIRIGESSRQFEGVGTPPRDLSLRR